MSSSKVCRHPRPPNNVRYQKAYFESESLQEGFLSTPINQKAPTYVAARYISSALSLRSTLLFSPFLPSMLSYSQLQQHLPRSIQGCYSAKMRYQGDCCPSACQPRLSYTIWASKWGECESLCTRLHNTYIGTIIFLMLSLVIFYASLDPLWGKRWISVFLL